MASHFETEFPLETASGGPYQGRSPPHKDPVTHSHFDDNLAAGVFIELLSEDVTVARSNITGTRRLGWTGAGILIQAAGTATLSENRIENNDGAGIWLRRDPRSEGGFNTMTGNIFVGNGRLPGQDHADIQIGAGTLLELCSNRLMENQLAEDGSFLFEVDETGETYEGNDLDQFSCLVDCSSR